MSEQMSEQLSERKSPAEGVSMQQHSAVPSLLYKLKCQFGEKFTVKICFVMCQKQWFDINLSIHSSVYSILSLHILTGNSL